jgi:hypothetical protein
MGGDWEVQYRIRVVYNNWAVPPLGVRSAPKTVSCLARAALVPGLQGHNIKGFTLPIGATFTRGNDNTFND